NVQSCISSLHDALPISFRNKDNSKLGFSCTTARDISPGVERDLLAMGLDVEEDNSIKRSYKSREFVIRNLKRTVERLKEENQRSEEHTSELQSRFDLVCRLLL